MGKEEIEKLEELEQLLSKLVEYRKQSDGLGFPTDDIDARILEIDAQKTAIQIGGSVSAGSVVGSGYIWAENIAGRDVVQVYIDKHIVSEDKKQARILFHQYLNNMWGRLIHLPLMTITERSTSPNDVPLSAIYTALDIKATISVGDEKQRRVIEGVARETGIHGLTGDRDYLQQLFEQVEIEARKNKKEHFSRRVTVLEAAAATQRLVLLGSAGSGKSTFAKYLALCMTGQLLNKKEANIYTLNELEPGYELPEQPNQDLGFKLRRLMRRLLGGDTKVYPHIAWPHGVLFPIFVELKHFVHSDSFPKEVFEGEAGHLINYIENRQPSPLSPDFVPYFQEYLLKQNGGALLVLDGLDEVPQAEERRERLRQIITSFTVTYPYCRILVTSRAYAYQKDTTWRLDGAGFEEVTLDSFDEEQIQAFIRHWYNYLGNRGQVSVGRIDQLVSQLWKQIEQVPYIRPLAESPLMLTMAVDLNAMGGQLYGSRAELYNRSVDLLLDRWNETRGVFGPALSKDLGMNVLKIRNALEELAFEVHKKRGGGGEDSSADISPSELWEALDKYRPQDSSVDYRRIMDSLHQRSGIIMGESPNHYRFPHRSYQEFFAASYLVRHDEFPRYPASLALDDPILWREVIVYIAELQARIPRDIWDLAAELCPIDEPALPVNIEHWWGAFFAGLVLVTAQLHRGVRRRYESLCGHVRQWLTVCLLDERFSSANRAEVGRILAAIGDERQGICQLNNDIPLIDWIDIPPSEFEMGEGDQLIKPYLSKYQISKYPITVAQFRPFVSGGGYENPTYWTKAGWDWKKSKLSPSNWSDSYWVIENHPVSGISWYEAYAYSRWLSERLGYSVNLPTEDQWEKAARGIDGQRYPWGNKYNSMFCNSVETGINRTSAVGMFLDGASPFGVLDMSGNVLEWCLTKWRESLKEPADNDPTGESSRVLRGGAFEFDATYVRCAYRARYVPDNFLNTFGFRLVSEEDY